MEPTEIIKALITSSPLAALLFYLWWAERKDRKQAEDARVEYLESHAEKMQDFVLAQKETIDSHTNSIDRLSDLLEGKPKA
ncbi:MAG: hypothetical protein GY772_17445 [bacterium]|nr:hypothetical protein [bacterium]